ncbi:MAG: IS21-like element helper ATPase IstB [Dehalococcoidales bacterium]|nr:IS21-like element helper ATPase IstB [Dehalococcoidales bacterium]
MLNQQTVSILHSLRLTGMARSFEERLSDPKYAELSHAEFVGLLVQDEKTYRDNRRLRRLLKKAKLRQEAALEDIDYGASRGLSQQVILDLANPQWIPAHRNVLISGPTGIGKSFIACALGNSAARAGYTVLYLRATRLFETLQQSRGDGSHLKTLTRLSRVQLLIIDDFLITPLTDWERRDLLEVIEDRYQAGATVITSQCPINDWHPNIGDPTLADAICDRLLHNAYKVVLKGDSLRRRSTAGKQKNEIKEAIVNDNKLR